MCRNLLKTNCHIAIARGNVAKNISGGQNKFYLSAARLAEEWRAGN